MRINYRFISENSRKLWIIVITLLFFYLTGLYEYIIESSFDNYIHWGPTNEIQPLISQMKKDGNPDIAPINQFNYQFTFIFQEKCESKDPIKLMIIVKSALPNFNTRQAIRNSWGYENRFSDVKIRTVFLVGINTLNHGYQVKLEKEANTNRDIIQAEFVDAYFNNTLKTMMGLHWAFNYCNSVQYFLFVDDDYYVSTRNALRFLRSPSNYPMYLEKYIPSAVNEYEEDLYAGYIFKHSKPFRWYFSKWYVPINEYPYSYFPPYITGGAYIISRKSLVSLYYASLYTTFFRMDDVFLGIAAYGIKMNLLHSEFFNLYTPYSLENFKWVIASHGFDDNKRMQEIWVEQRAAGNA